MRTLLFFKILFFTVCTSVNSQNLLEKHRWTIGKGNSSGFYKNGKDNENIREYGKNHIGQKVILWKAVPDASSNADGGWNSSYKAINHKKTYRFSVWLKKTNSNSGHSYFGCTYGTKTILKLSGSVNRNPYFWHGDLPKLNRWYLLIGFVHGSGYTSKKNYGAIYDGVTGKKVKTITDFKFKAGAKAVRHRAYLYYDTNTLDRQYFYEPRIDLVNGKEPNINTLLKINRQSKIVFRYDTAGNQKQVFYCGNAAYCSPPSARKKKKRALQKKEIAEEKQAEEELVTTIQKEEEIPVKKTLDTRLLIYPNPTQGQITLSLGNDLLKNIHSINLYNSNAALVKKINATSNTIALDISGMATGVYFLHIHLIKGKSITKKIIKK